MTNQQTIINQTTDTPIALWTAALFQCGTSIKMPTLQWPTCTFFRATIVPFGLQHARKTVLNCPRPIFFSISKFASRQYWCSPTGGIIEHWSVFYDATGWWASVLSTRKLWNWEENWPWTVQYSFPCMLQAEWNNCCSEESTGRPLQCRHFYGRATLKECCCP